MSRRLIGRRLLGAVTGAALIIGLVACHPEPVRRMNRPAPVAPVVPQEAQARTSAQVTVLAVVDAPDPACVRMITLTDQRTYRLLGPAAPASTLAGAGMRPRLLWLTGHAIPSTGNPIETSQVRGCPAAGTFSVDRARPVSTALAALVDAVVLPGPFASVFGLFGLGGPTLASTPDPQEPPVRAESVDHYMQGGQG